MRFIGIRHRVKQTAAGEAQPTQLAIRENGAVTLHDLETETDELDFVLGHCPVKYRKVKPDENLSDFLPHHIQMRELKKGEDPAAYPPNLVRTEGKTHFLATQVPAAYIGLERDDTVAMVLGGSGDKLAFALSRRAEELGGRTLVARVPSFVLKFERGSEDKTDDASLLATLAETKLAIFQVITPRERDLIREREALAARIDAMKARIGCEQRLRQHFIGSLFCNPEGKYPEGEIERAYDQRRASDEILAALETEESRRERELVKVVGSLDVWKEVFEPIEGCGPMISARLISAIIDIRRFANPQKLKRFCGVHVMEDGRFPRRRGGEVANWHPDARQALYLLGDQFNRRPNSLWGKVLIAYKERLRAAHPDIVEENRKKRYTNGHIHKMAIWRTLTKFVEWLWIAWWKVEERHGATRPTGFREPFLVGVSTPVASSTQDAASV